MERPLCSCHEEPMLWNRDLRLLAGGRWHCRIHNRAWARARYAANPEPKRATNRAFYEANALQTNMRRWRNYHRNRQAVLEERANG